MEKITELIDASNKIVKTLLEVKPNERVLIIGDFKTDIEMLYSLAGTVLAAHAEPTVIIIPTGEPGTHVVTKPLEKAMESVDVVICNTITTHGPVRSDAALGLQEKKIRYFCLGERTTKQVLDGARSVDLHIMEEISKTNEKLDKILRKGKKIHVVTRSGTDITANIEGLTPICFNGVCSEPGDRGALPFAEVHFCPLESTAEGIAVIDGPIGHASPINLPTQPVKLTFRRGRAVSVEGGKEAESLRKFIRKFKNADNFCEIGIGTDSKLQLTGEVEAEKKVLGTAHFALGDGRIMGGTRESPVHIDMVIYKPTIEVDGQVIMKEGELQV